MFFATAVCRWATVCSCPPVAVGSCFHRGSVCLRCCVCLCVGEAEQIKFPFDCVHSVEHSAISTQAAICPNKRLQQLLPRSLSALSPRPSVANSLICSPLSPSACLPLHLSVYLHFTVLIPPFFFAVCPLSNTICILFSSTFLILCSKE